MLKLPIGFILGHGQLVDNETLSPLLIVGVNSYVRERVAPNVLQDWDIFLFYCPNQDGNAVVLVVGMSRLGNAAFANYAMHSTVDAAIDTALGMPIDSVEFKPKRLAWLNLSIYRCPKVALRDVLSLKDAA